MEKKPVFSRHLTPQEKPQRSRPMNQKAAKRTNIIRKNGLFGCVCIS
jgi:hypothetical protein